MDGKDSKPAQSNVYRSGSHDSETHIEDIQGKTVAGTTLPTANIRKTIKPLTLLAICFNICSSWAGLATSIQIALVQGGPMTLIYGIIVATIIYLGISLILAELASVYPVAGGQYHFTSILAPENVNRVLSYVDGWLTNFTWIATGAAVLVITSYQLEAVALYFHPETIEHPWHIFLIYQGWALIIVLYNIFLIKRVPVTHTLGFALSLALFTITFVALLARAQPKATDKFVWDSFINYTGWPDGVTFMTGLLTPFFMYGGIDGSCHLAEEADNPRKVVPRVCVGVVIVGFITAFPFAVATLYSISDFEAILETAGWIPLLINQQGLRSDTAAITLLIAGLVLGFCVLNASFQASSRVVWAFARDNGFKFSGTLSTIHPKLDVPVWALLLNWALVAAVGFLILASSVAFNAIISSLVVHQLASMWIPFALLLYRKRSRDFLPPDREYFKLPRTVGWVVNIAVVLVIPVVVVFFTFPPFLPVTGENMNYTVVVMGIVAILGLLNWVFHARKHYQGPRMEWQL